MRKYKIGQLSSSMGVSTHLLKHYEKFNLLQPTKDDSTNYRYYDISQGQRVIESKRYRNMGFPLKETAELINESSTEEMDDMLMDQIGNLEQQIRELETQKLLAMMYQEECNRMKRYLGQWFIVEMEEYYYYCQTNNRVWILEKELSQFQENILEYAPISKSVVRIEKESFVTKEPAYHWGIGFFKQEIDHIKHHKIEFEKLERIPRGRAYCAYIRVEAPYMDNMKLVDEIRERYREFGGSMDSDPMAICVKVTREEGREVHYFQVFVPLQKKS